MTRRLRASGRARCGWARVPAASVLGPSLVMAACAGVTSAREATPGAAGDDLVVRGTVSGVHVPAPGEASQNLQVVVSLAGGGSLRVELAPAWHFDRQGLRFDREQSILVLGARAGREAIVARSVEIGGRQLRLRDEGGRPLWNGGRGAADGGAD